MITQDDISRMQDAPALDEILDKHGAPATWDEILTELSPYLTDNALQELDQAITTICVFLNAEIDDLTSVDFAALSGGLVELMEDRGIVD